MADQSYIGTGLAVGVQTARGTINGTIAGLGGALTSADGIVLGDRESGEHNSGIVLPEHVREQRELADDEMTKQKGSFLRVGVEGFAITVPLKGNGAVSGGLQGEAVPLAGIDALLRGSGLERDDNVIVSAPVVLYQPASTNLAFSADLQEYLTLKLWYGDQSFVYEDCIVAGLAIAQPPGDVGLATFTFAVGGVNAQAGGITFPTFDYTTQLSLDSPIVQGVAHAFGQTRGFNTYDLTLDNTSEEIDDSNAPNGVRQEPSERTISVDATLFVDDGDTSFDWDQLNLTTVPASPMSHQVGAIAGVSDAFEAYALEMLQPAVLNHKPTKLGVTAGHELSLRATHETPGSEFRLRFN